MKTKLFLAALTCCASTAGIAQDRSADYDENAGPTGAFFLEGKWSQNLGAVYRFGLTESDLFGQNIGAELSFAKTSAGSEKRLVLDKRFELARGTLSVSGSYLDRSYDNERFDLVRKAASVRYDMPVSGTSTLRVGAFGRLDNVSNVRSGTSPIIAADAGERSTVGLELGFAFDTRDNAVLPSSGIRAEFGGAVASVDGGSGWQSVYTDAEAYVPIGSSAFAKFSFAAGHIQGTGGQSVPVTERAFPGGDTPRGFAATAFGPRDGGDVLGGKSYVFGSVEAFAPILQNRTQRLFAGAFLDAGSVWGLDNTAGSSGVVDDSYYLRSSAGLSLSYLTDFGRLEASVAKPLRSKPGDQTRAFAVQLETRF